VLLPLKMVRQAERYDVKAPYRLFWAEGVGAWDGEDDSPWEDYEESELEGGKVSGSSNEEGGVGEVAAEDGESPRNENLSGNLGDDTL
jgi:hypothetical protein